MGGCDPIRDLVGFDPQNTIHSVVTQELPDNYEEALLTSRVTSSVVDVELL